MRVTIIIPRNKWLYGYITGVIPKEHSLDYI